jgi:hypothetical protein
VNLLDQVLEAHGGEERWRAANRISARVRGGGLLLRTRVPGNRFADYRVVAEVIGRWAHAAHMCADHVESGGLIFPTRRWVRPIGPANRPMPFPTMVSLRFGEIEVR